MGCGSFSASSYASYSTARGRTFDSVTCSLTDNVSSHEMFTQRRLHEQLDVKNKIRECCDNAEHPNTVPVILALDVTGSMGDAAVKVAKSLGCIMKEIYEETKDVEFSIMAIGDIECDMVPIQMSQFESDIRIAEALDNVYFEYGGGGNGWESYSLAWYTGLKHARLDCWKRGKKGIIITLGDEPLNPYIMLNGASTSLKECLGDNEQAKIDTKDLYELASEKYDIYHISVTDSGSYYYRKDRIDSSFKEVLPKENYFVACINELPGVISKIINEAAASPAQLFDGKEITW